MQPIIVSRRQFLQKSATLVVEVVTEPTPNSPSLLANGYTPLSDTITKLTTIPKALADDAKMPRRDFLIWFRQIFS